MRNLFHILDLGCVSFLEAHLCLHECNEDLSDV
jgi:hypothetical protein